MIREPRLNVYSSSANPLMILGILIFVSPFVLKVVGNTSPLIEMLLMILGGFIFGLGLIYYGLNNL